MSEKSKKVGDFPAEKIMFVLQGLKGLPQKSPLSFEISRATKVALPIAEQLEAEKGEIMSTWLLRDENGQHVINESTQKQIEEARAIGKVATPTVFAYIVDASTPKQLEKKQEEYTEIMRAFLDKFHNLKIKGIDAKAKNVKYDKQTVPLISVLSEYFTVGQIDLLETIGLLVNLD